MEHWAGIVWGGHVCVLACVFACVHRWWRRRIINHGRLPLTKNFCKKKKKGKIVQNKTPAWCYRAFGRNPSPVRTGGVLLYFLLINFCAPLLFLFSFFFLFIIIIIIPDGSEAASVHLGGMRDDVRFRIKYYRTAEMLYVITSGCRNRVGLDYGGYATHSLHLSGWGDGGKNPARVLFPVLICHVTCLPREEPIEFTFFTLCRDARWPCPPFIQPSNAIGIEQPLYRTQQKFPILSKKKVVVGGK